MAIEIDFKFVNPRITNAQTAFAEVEDWRKNPPTNGFDAIKKFASAAGLTPVLSGALNSVFPGAGSVLSSLAGIFSGFSSGPTFEETAIDLLQGLGYQISSQFDSLRTDLKLWLNELQSTTIETVLSGVDDISRQEAAADVMAALNESVYLQAVAEDAQSAYDSFQKQLSAEREAFLEKLTADIDAIRAAINAMYEEYLANVLQMLNEIMSDLAYALEAFLNSQAVPAEVATVPPVTRAAPITQQTPQDDASSMGLILAVAAIGGFFIYWQKRKKN